MPRRRYPDFKDQPTAQSGKAYVEGLDKLIRRSMPPSVCWMPASWMKLAAALDGMAQTKKEYHKKLKV